MRLPDLVLSALLLVPLAASAEVLNPSQVDCALALQRAGARVARVATAQTLGCIDAAAHGPEAADACIARDPGHRVARARRKTEAVARKRCTEPPPLGFADATAVNDALTGVLRLTGVLGHRLAPTRLLSGGRPGLALDGAGERSRADVRCQRALVRGLARTTLGRLDRAGACMARVLRKTVSVELADLQRCLVDDGTGLAGQRAIARACRGVAIGPLVTGGCRSNDLDTVTACAGAEARCGACLALAGAGTLGTTCDAVTGITPSTVCRAPRGSDRSVAREWDEAILAAIRIDLPRPPVHARNLFHLSVAMWDAWAAYDDVAAQYRHHERRPSLDVEPDRDATISFAAYRLIRHRYANSANASKTREALDETLRSLGYDPAYEDATGDRPASLGIRIAADVIASTLDDGANESINYADPTYTPVNMPCVVKEPGTTMVDPNRWQPLTLDTQIGQNGVPIPGSTQRYVGPQWGGVTPFALPPVAPGGIHLDPGEPPRLGGVGDAQFKARILNMLRLASHLTIDDGATIDLSPAAWGNNPLGTNDGTGYPVNPITGQPYPPNVVKHGDFARVLAEFWADGPTSETPPGHWNSVANAASDDPAMVRRIGGTGPEVDRLEWDVKMYLALNGALHDAAIQCWGVKRRYDGVRPISMIRYMGGLGQSSDPMGPSYHPLGLPLDAGLVEVITPQSSAPGERHAHLAAYVGQIAVYSWPGQPADPTTQYSGVRWVRAVEWVPYQRNTFVTPPFPGFASGHSTYSRAAAELLTRFTGSSYFPGGLGTFDVTANRLLQFEIGPSTDVQLQWAQYYDAADQAGLSRLYGGIHTAEDDFAGRIAGAQIGVLAWDRAERYFTGTTPP